MALEGGNGYRTRSNYASRWHYVKWQLIMCEVIWKTDCWRALSFHFNPVSKHSHIAMRYFNGRGSESMLRAYLIIIITLVPSWLTLSIYQSLTDSATTYTNRMRPSGPQIVVCRTRLPQHDPANHIFIFFLTLPENIETKRPSTHIF